ncbi:MAG: beta-ketoacyl synthase chain length factor [Mariprofundus sp.]|nr:beta-ketoacyl synthase chain length factor [Mariprofundus sp.]
MDKTSIAITGTGISFLHSEEAEQFGFNGCDMESTLLPAKLKRRTSKATRMAFAAAQRACQHAAIAPPELPVIFVSSLGELAVTDRLCMDIAQQRFPISPTQFHNSVHNTASGYWSIAVGNTHPAMAMAAYQDGFALALLEAWSQLQCVTDKLLLVCYEEELPQRMLANNHWLACATAFVLSRAPNQSNAMTLSLPTCETTTHPAIDYRACSPALASQPLLTALHQRQSGRVHLSPQADATWFTELAISRVSAP